MWRSSPHRLAATVDGEGSLSILFPVEHKENLDKRHKALPYLWVGTKKEIKMGKLQQRPKLNGMGLLMVASFCVAIFLS